MTESMREAFEKWCDSHIYGARGLASRVWMAAWKAAENHHSQPKQWIKCSDRLPTDEDGDCHGEVWLSCTNCDGVRLEPWAVRWSDVTSGEGFWMPTNLKRPEPPKE